jgi:cytochrome c oxidase assembly protein subunit 15
MPEMTGGVFFEHGHRMVGALVGLLTIGLALWIARSDPRAWMRKLGWIALAAVVVQGLLGGLTVKLLLPPAVSITHACMAQLFFSAIVAITLFSSHSWNSGPKLVDDQGWPPLRALAVLAPVFTLAQIALGAGFRHRAIGLMPHVIGAIAVAAILLLVAVFVLHQFPEHQALRKSAMSLLILTFVQVMLGVAAYLTRFDAAQQPLAMVLATVAHVATGALTLAASIVLAIQIRRNVRSVSFHSAHVAVSR